MGYEPVEEAVLSPVVLIRKMRFGKIRSDKVVSLRGTKDCH